MTPSHWPDFSMTRRRVLTLGALEACLRAEGFALPAGAAVEQALAAWNT